MRTNYRPPRHARLVMLCLLLLFSARPVYADAGLPTIVAIWPWSMILLLPVLIVEMVAALHILRRPLKLCLCLSATANTVSTLVGIPFVWSAFFVLEIATGWGWAGTDTGVLSEVLAITLQSPWLVPSITGDPQSWMLPAAVAFLCIPFFFASVLIEYVTARVILGSNDVRAMKRWSWLANVLSYGAIFIFLIVQAIRSV